MTKDVNLVTGVSSRQHPRVLLVEDEKVNQRVALAMLRHHGIVADVTGNGYTAVEMVCQGNYNLVLMDCNLPDISGFEACMAIRTWEKANHRPAVPIIALTACAMDGDRERCLQAGMNDYLSKPVAMQQFRDVLVHWLEHSQAD